MQQPDILERLANALLKMAMRHDCIGLLRDMSWTAEHTNSALDWSANSTGLYLPADIRKDLRESDLSSQEANNLTFWRGK